jgi:hypothetical protein
MTVRESVFLVTDRAVSDVYRGIALDPGTTSFYDAPGIPSLNLGGTPESLFRIFQDLETRFYSFCGSSNFHHIDTVNLSRLRSALGLPLQLILVDQHMDCCLYEEDRRFLHCGNWVSYAYRKGLISKAVMIGCRDYRKLSNFDSSLEKDGNLVYIREPSEADLNGWLDPGQPCYLSIDTDVLSVPSDWGMGLHTLEALLSSPFWGFLEKADWVGAFLHGHVTDDRRFLDMALASFRGPQVKAAGNPFRDLGVNLMHAVWPKLRASLFLPTLTMEEQLGIMLALYARCERARRR